MCTKRCQGNGDTFVRTVILYFKKNDRFHAFQSTTYTASSYTPTLHRIGISVYTIEGADDY